MTRFLRTSDAWIFGGLLLVAAVVKGPALAAHIGERISASATTALAVDHAAQPVAGTTVAEESAIPSFTPGATAAGGSVQDERNAVRSTQPVVPKGFARHCSPTGCGSFR